LVVDRVAKTLIVLLENKFFSQGDKIAMNRMEGIKVVVTGGGSGIGRALALGFASEGAEVVISYNRNRKPAEEVAGEIDALGRRAKAFHVDLRVKEAIQPFVDQAASFLGEIQVLVNNAGVLTRTPFLEIAPDELEHTLAVNIVAPFLMTQAVARQMKNRGIRGSIINVSSISDHVCVTGLSHYQCSKAGLTMLTRGAAYELAPFGIRVNAIAPGLTATEINRDLREKKITEWQSRSSEIPIGRAGVPKDHVGAVLFLASEEASWITGTLIVVDGGRTLL
jgi:NAD(P)-dependent dehydrogenase (short-subunit alcohol dehydrogenase family)